MPSRSGSSLVTVSREQRLAECEGLPSALLATKTAPGMTPSLQASSIATSKRSNLFVDMFSSTFVEELQQTLCKFLFQTQECK